MKTKRSSVVHAALVLAFASPALIQAAHVRSCTQNGQAHVPCQDQLYLEEADKYLITLGGHSCYSVSLQSESPLDAYFYASSEYLQPINTAAHLHPSPGVEHRQLRGMDTEQLKLDRSEAAKDTISMPSTTARSLYSALICKHRYSCEATKRGISPRSIYSLVIARARRNASMHEKDDSGASVLVNLAPCDPVSFWYYVGLFVVTGVGFCSGMSLLVCIAEYLLGLRMVSRMRNRMTKIQFIELTQFDPSPDEHEDDDGSEPKQPAKQQEDARNDDVADGACPPPA